jgi:hypothetical protein
VTMPMLRPSDLDLTEYLSTGCFRAAHPTVHLSRRRSNVLSKGSALTDHMPSTTTFHHRAKDDGTFDSICTCCFRTVAFAMKDSRLAELIGPYETILADVVALQVLGGSS